MSKQAGDIIILGKEEENEHMSFVENADQITEIRRQDKSTTAGKLLLKAHPSWLNFFWYLVFGWLIIPLIIALWKRAGLLLCIYRDRVVLERGVLSKHVTQILLADIRSLDSKQSVMQRIFRIGDILIGTAGMSDYEMVARGLSNPRGIVDLILQQRQWSKRTDE